MPVVILTGNTVNTETFYFLYLGKFWFKFFYGSTHIGIIRRSVLQSAINNRCVFVTSHRTIPFKFAIRIPLQIPFVRQRLHIRVSPMIFRYIREGHVFSSYRYLTTHEFLNHFILLSYNLL